jgi:hypothetical protein
MRIDVAATLTISSPAPATALLQVAVADPASEQLTVLSGGSTVAPEEFEVDGARVHRLHLLEGDTTSSTGACRAPSSSRPSPIGSTAGWSTPPARAARWTPPWTPCWPVRACAGTTRT